MRELTDTEKQQLEQHRLWVASDGAKGTKLNWCGADLSGADLNGADLSGADASGAYLFSANLGGANLGGTNLGGADLRHATLRGADLRHANLGSADLSQVEGLLSQRDWLDSHCVLCDGLLIAYKVQKHIYDAPAWPDSWVWKPGAVLREVVNRNRTDECGCGVNVATLGWACHNADGSPIWQVLVDPRGVVVPYNTDGKFRAEWVQLVKIIEEEK